MRIDLLEKPETSWLEDKDRNRLPNRSENDWAELKKGQYQNYIFLETRHSVYTAKPKYKRWKAWVARKLRLRYDTNGLIFEGHRSGNSITPIVRELLNRGWELSDAAIVAYDLCEGCLNTVLSEIEGWEYAEDPGTCCKYCQAIRPEIVKKEDADEQN